VDLSSRCCERAAKLISNVNKKRIQDKYSNGKERNNRLLMQ